MLPNLLGGKLLTGVLPPDKHDHSNPWLPSHSPIADIESCIDDPTLAPLGGHIRTISYKQKQKKKDYKGQVKIQRKYDLLHKDIHGAGLLMLRRKNLTAIDLAQLLNTMAPLAPFLKKQHLQSNSYFDGLVELDISRNKLSSLPSEISLLTQLRTLNASSNLLTHLPTELYHLTQLEVLLLSQNQLQIIPDDLPIQLPCLVTLSVAGNMIDYLTHKVNQWKHMRHLQLGSVFGGNLLTQIPDTIVEMPSLEELDLSFNQLCVLPSNMYIPSLLHLNVSRNKLDSLPTSIGRCHGLKTLNVSKNHLTTLPANLVELDNLELLDISENLLCIMPADILERMKTTLLISGNPLTRPGHCDLSNSSDAYAQVLKRMTMRALPMMPSSSASSSSSTTSSKSGGLIHSYHHHRHHQCGPQGSGCLGSTSLQQQQQESTVSSSLSPDDQKYTSSLRPHPSMISSPTAAPSSSPSSSSTSSRISSSFGSLSTSTSLSQPSLSIPIPSVSVPTITLRDDHHNNNNNDNDDDASIDRELSFLAQQLNVQGARYPLTATLSRSGSPLSENPATTVDNDNTSSRTAATTPTGSRIGTPLQDDMFSRSLLMETMAANMEEDDTMMENSGGLACTLYDHSTNSETSVNTNIVHSLRELATRVILQSKKKVPLHMIPPHLANDLAKHNRRWCAKCQQPFVNEWLTSVQVKSYSGHPAVVRRVRFCSTRCWQQYLHSRKSVVCVHRAESQPILRQSAEQEESDWLQASSLVTDSLC